MSLATKTGRFFKASRDRLELLRELRREEGLEAAEAPAIPRRRDPASHPLSFSQERLWFLDRLDPENPAYNIPVSLRLRGRLDAAALARALDGVVRRHEVLRATFHDEGGRPLQRVRHASVPLPLPILDLGSLPPAQRDEEARRAAASAASRPFRLDRGPLLRARLIRLGGEEHALGLEVHHIVADGWSLGVLVRELTALYAGEALPELPIQYADYAAWQRQRLTGEALAEQLAWWRAQLAGSPGALGSGLPPALDLPTDRPRPAVQTFHGGHAAGVLPAALVDRLRSLAGEAGASLFMVLLAAVQLLLARWSGQEDVPVGSPIAGRTRREVEGLIGLFLNHLVLRTDLSGDPTFRELLGRVRDMAVGAYAHQDLPFEKLLAEIEPQRDLSRTPLFQVYFNLLSFPVPDARLPGLTMEGHDVPPEVQSKFDMTFYLVEQDGSVRIDLVYNADLFDAARMAEALAQYCLLMEQAAAGPDAPIGSYSLVTAAARAILPDPTAELDASWPGTVADALSRHARATPDRPAVLWEGGQLSYRQLDDEVERIAAGLRAAGIGHGEVVAIRGHRSAPLVAAVLGVLRAGAAFLILDPAYPEQRNDAMLELAGARGVLTLRASLPSPALPYPGRGGATSLQLEILRQGGSPSPGGWEGDGRGGQGVRDGDLAYLAFTSGSTGTPKGVLGLHRSLTHFYPWMRAAFELGPDDRFSLLSGLAHDPLHRDLFTPLWLGAAVAIPDPERMAEPGWLAGWMARAGVTVAHLTPAMGRLLTGPPAGPMPSLRRAFFVGDALTRRDVERLRALAPEVACVNLYGSTETQRAVGFHQVKDDEAREVYPLGRGLPDVQLLVLNRSGHFAGVGEAGEVGVRSPHLAAGYLGDPGLTAERFVTNPFTGREGDRIYRTGDLGRYRADGEVEPLGRADHQVKIRGFRVELGEVEAALARHPAVCEAVVVARGERGDRRLVAYVVAVSQEGGETPDPRELRELLRARLPEYMVPTAFVFLDALPLTPNRKVDRQALPEPGRPEPAEAAVDRTLRTPIEELLAAIWSEVLETGRIGPEDDFFALGGHSLRVTQVLARVREALGVELPVRSLFESPTLGGLAARIEEALRAGSARPAPPLRPTSREGDLPLSFAQERLWFLDRLAPGGAAYNMPAALRLRGALDPAALERTLHAIVRRHESLRTTFPEGPAVDPEPRQRVHPFRPFPLPIVDLCALLGEVREAEAVRQAGAEAARPFDLARGPLLRAALLRLEEREWLALLTTHHIVSDGWSVGVLVREIAALSAGRSLPGLPVQYADFAVWQRGWLQGEALEAQIAFWRQVLAGAPAVLDLPLDRPRLPGTGSAGRRAATLPPELAGALRELGRRQGATLFMVLLAAFQALLHRLTGEDDLVVGTPIANRTHPGLEGLIGFFVNTLALRSRLDGADPAFADLLGRARAAALAAYAHQDLPFEKLVEELRVERSLRHTPVFQVMLALQNAPREELELPGLTLAPIPPAGPGAAKLDLSLSFVEAGSEIRALLEHDARLFDATTAERMLARLGVLLREIAAHPELRLSALPVMADAERHQVTVEWPEPASPPPAPFPLHRRFEEWAARTPKALAIGGDGRSLTYAELDRAANRLAHALRDAGAEVEARVGVSVERPEGWALALLAVLKAGAVYLPLDPHLPAERLAFLIADAGASLLLTEEALLTRLPDGPRVVLLDRVDRDREPGPETPPALELHPDSLAYVFYTSGSTGAPKGVAVPLGALARHEADMARRFELGPGDRLLGVYAEGFDPSLEQMLAPLVSGGAYFPRAGRMWSVAELADRFQRWGITAAMMPSAYWRQIVADLATAGPAGHLLGSGALRILEAGGEAMPLELARQWLAVAPGARLCNSYGPTETVITPTVFEATAEVQATPSGSVPIGRTVAGRSAWVVDRQGRPVPIGVAGELWLGGPLARGYLGRPAATAAAFVPDPDPRAAPGARLYRTGDRVRLLADGNLEFLGRLDRQVKVRGQRVEPGEVEAALTAEPAVREAAVVMQGESLVAWLVAGDPAAEPPDPDLLRASLRRLLPEVMIPSAFGWLDALPLTANGKVDRRALAAREIDRLASAGLPPRDDLERGLAQIWEDLLGVRPIGARDDFFDLGGHSLLAVRLASRVEARFGRPLPIATLFERRTIEALADWLRPSFESAGGSPLVRIQPALHPMDRRPPLFLVHPGGGGVLCYAELARALGPDQPVYGLQAPGLDGERPPLDRIGEMADLYLEAVRAAQPAGPWHLGGWSFGGLVAYEMACRLAERGEPAGLVAILDVPAHVTVISPDEEAELLVRGLDESFLQAVPVSPEELRGLDTRSQVALVLERARRTGRLGDDLDERRIIGLVEVFKANLRAANTWEPRPYPGRVTVVRAAGSDRVDRPDGDSDGGWSALAAADVVTVPGDHHSMVTPPHVESLARALRLGLDGTVR